MSKVEHIAGHTWHGRKGDVKNAFRYGVDYVLLDAEAAVDGPSLFARNRAGLTSLQDRDHGGALKEGRGAAWVREVLTRYQLPFDGSIQLLTQPRVLGHVFNPVSFWLVHDLDERLCAVIAEVTNTFGDRHSYLCHNPDLSPIRAEDRITAQKVFHVSPFQPVSGGYTFRFDIREDRIGIWIDLETETGGVMATLTGPRAPLTNRAILSFLIRRPIGARRVLALIHWQALKLWWKGATYRARPLPPEGEVTR